MTVTPPTDAQIVQALQAVISALAAEATTPAQAGDAQIATAAAQALIQQFSPQPQPTQTVTVGPADTLFTLAAAVYGDARLYQGLVSLNNLTDPRLTPGQTLIVPAS